MIPEVAQYLERIEDLRGQVGDLIKDLSAAALNWRPVEGESGHGTNSLAVLAAHVVGAEGFWIHEVIGAHPATRERQQELVTRIDDPKELLAKFTLTGEATREILSSLQASHLEEPRKVRSKVVSVRWAVLHVIDHTALHLGHMQLTYQLWDEGRGIQSPRWFQRI
jgi:uncharacterized damage-inducible protein DinB